MGNAYIATAAVGQMNTRHIAYFALVSFGHCRSLVLRETIKFLVGCSKFFEIIYKLESKLIKSMRWIYVYNMYVCLCSSALVCVCVCACSSVWVWVCTGSIQLQYKALCLLLVRSWVSPLFLVTSQLFRASRVISLRPLPDWICLIFESVWGPLCTVFIYTHPKCLNVLCVHPTSQFIHSWHWLLFIYFGILVGFVDFFLLSNCCSVCFSRVCCDLAT